jgi:methylthioribulose-1-phosphate dehydratase
MSPKRSAEELITSMIDAARDFYRFGWMHAASGNLSARKNKSSILITASRVHKRDLTPEDFVTIDLKGKSDDDAAPSMDTEVHLALHRLTEGTGAVYHVHHLAAALCSDRDQKAGRTFFDSLEMLRAFGIEEEGATAEIPILDNLRDRSEMADQIEEVLKEDRRIPCINVKHHGIYVWGPDPEATRRHLEACAYLFAFSQARPMHPADPTSVSGFRF